MSYEWENLKWLLERGIEKHGEKPLTNKWLLNLMRKAEKLAEKDALCDEFFNHIEDARG